MSKNSSIQQAFRKPLGHARRAHAPAWQHRFYDPVMELLGLRMLECEHNGVHYGTGNTFFSLVVPTNGEVACGGNGTHIAFAARDRTMVEKFHTIALSHGGRSDGEPGIRPEYGANYFGAFVFDPDGNKIEVVTHSAE
jgi:catechol 2,3-dioxygenase-like lactoylglutathione lyase family enzyme